MKKQAIIITALIVILLGTIIVSPSIIKKDSKTEQVNPTVSEALEVNEKFTYEGKEGVDALTLLKEETAIKQDNSGLVISIDGRDADSSRREYWSFYVNGKMASVGPADYITNGKDKLEWRLENF